jgi:hypothetical protein
VDVPIRFGMLRGWQPTAAAIRSLLVKAEAGEADRAKPEKLIKTERVMLLKVFGAQLH